MADGQEQNNGNEGTGTQNNSGSNNEGTGTQNNSGSEAQVTMSQEDLNNLINGKFAKGADKATKDLLADLGIENVEALKGIIEAKKAADEASKTEMEKLAEQMEALKAENSTLASRQQEALRKASINELAVKSGVADLGYFEYEYNKVSSAEGFNAEDFIKGLKETKPFVFGQSTTPPGTDSSSNGGQQPANFAERVKQAKTKKELDALYAELG